MYMFFDLSLNVMLLMYIKYLTTHIKNNHPKIMKIIFRLKKALVIRINKIDGTPATIINNPKNIFSCLFAPN